MGISSVRFRLTLWNIGILALVLFGFLLIVHVSVRSYLLSATDHRLRGMTQRSASILTHGQPPSAPSDGFPRFLGSQRERLVRRFDLDGKHVGLFGEPPTTPEVPLDDLALKTATSGKPVFSTVKRDDTTYRVFSQPIVQEDKVIGTLQAAVSFAEVEALLQNLTITLIILIPVALLVAGVGGLFLTSRALRPVRQIADTAKSLSADDLSQRLPVLGADEFAHLAETINDLLSRVDEAFTQLREAIERERRFTADASHELRTPLTAIKANTSLALRVERSSSEYKDALRIIDQSADTMNRLVQDLLLLAGSENTRLALTLEDVDTRELFVEATESVRVGGNQARVSLAGDSPVVIRGDRHHLLRLVVNLLDNALRHTPADGEVILEPVKDQDRALLIVRDNGEGIAPEHLPHLCERFYRVDAARTREQGGFGLGLTICQSIVDAHGGSMEIESSPGKGTTVKIILPQ